MNFKDTVCDVEIVFFNIYIWKIFYKCENIGMFFSELHYFTNTQ